MYWVVSAAVSVDDYHFVKISSEPGSRPENDPGNPHKTLETVDVEAGGQKCENVPF